MHVKDTCYGDLVLFGFFVIKLFTSGVATWYCRDAVVNGNEQRLRPNNVVLVLVPFDLKAYEIMKCYVLQVG